MALSDLLPYVNVTCDQRMHCLLAIINKMNSEHSARCPYAYLINIVSMSGGAGRAHPTPPTPPHPTPPHPGYYNVLYIKVVNNIVSLIVC